MSREAAEESRPWAGKLAVCHIASGDRWAGAEVQLLALLKQSSRIPDLNLCVIFLNEGRPAAEARKLGFDVCVFQEAKQGFLEILAGARRFLAGREIQVLHSHRYKENLLAAILARRCRVPIHVSTYHGAPEPFRGWRGIKQRALQFVDLQVALHATDRVISVSDELRAGLTRTMPADEVVTIHNGIDENTVSSRFTVREAKQRLGIPADCPVVGTAGRLDPVKRLDILLRAAKKIASEIPEVRFVVAGEGTETPRLRELAASLGIERKLSFLGHREDIYDVLRALDIFALCSDHEGLPMALLETLFLGVPVVARPVGGIPEVIQDRVSGVFVRSADPDDLASACTALLKDAPRRRELAAAGTAVVESGFTSRDSAERTVALYRSLLSAAKTKAV